MNAVTTERHLRHPDCIGVADELFSDGDWHLVVPGDGRQGCEVIHFCSRDEDGKPIHWCYSHWDDPVCPGVGCKQRQPDSIQTLEKFMNADTDRGSSAHVSSMIDRSIKQVFWHGMKKIALSGNGL